MDHLLKTKSFNLLIPVVDMCSFRLLSTASSVGSKPVRISNNLSFRAAQNSKFDSNKRPIVLVYGWLVAKSQHIHKYGDFYLGRGYDVLHIKVEPLQLLWPRRAQAVVSQITDFVSEDARSNQPIIVHGFSVGGYLYGETLVNFVSESSRQEKMKKRVKGQIFDSPVDLEGVPRGVGMALSEVRLVQKSIKFMLDSYLYLFHKQVTQHYLKASSVFHNNPLHTPSLVLHSLTDKVGIPGPIEVVMSRWREQGIPVKAKCWPDSPHVGHYKRHPVEYTAALNDFLTSIGYHHDEAAEKMVDNVKNLTDKSQKLESTA